MELWEKCFVNNKKKKKNSSFFSSLSLHLFFLLISFPFSSSTHPPSLPSFPPSSIAFLNLLFPSHFPLTLFPFLSSLDLLLSPSLFLYFSLFQPLSLVKPPGIPSPLLPSLPSPFSPHFPFTRSSSETQYFFRPRGKFFLFAQNNISLSRVTLFIMFRSGWR